MTAKSTAHDGRLREKDKLDIAALKRAHQDQADLDRRIADFQRWLGKKKAGKLKPYEVVR